MAAATHPAGETMSGPEYVNMLIAWDYSNPNRAFERADEETIRLYISDCQKALTMIPEAKTTNKDITQKLIKKILDTKRMLGDYDHEKRSVDHMSSQLIAGFRQILEAEEKKTKQ